MPLNRGMSKDKNLGILESCIALIKIIYSGMSGYSLFRVPAITSTFSKLSYQSHNDLVAIIAKKKVYIV